MCDDIELLREHLGIVSWDVFGHSFGSKYALNYILHYPQSIKKVILSAAPAAGGMFDSSFQDFKNPKPENLTNLEIELYHEIKAEESKQNPDNERLYRLSAAMRARYYVAKPENYSKLAHWWLYQSKPTVPPSKLYLSSNNKSVKNLLKNLGRFQNEVLIIHGLSDFIDVSNPLKNHKIFPNSQLKFLKEAGHTMSIDSKEEYFGIINEFLDY